METNLQASDYNLAEGSGIIVRGFRLASVASRAAALKTLLRAFNADLVMRNGQLTLMLRGRLPTATLTDDHLGARLYGAEHVPAIARQRPGGEGTLPRSVTVTFIDEEKGYEPGSQTAVRLGSQGGTELSLQLAVVMTNDEAIQIAETVLHSAHVEAVQYNLSVMPSRTDDVQPGEVIELLVNDVLHTVRVDKADIVEGGIVSAMARRYDASTYTDNSVGGAPLPDSRAVTVLGTSVGYVMNLPLLNSGTAGNTVFVAASSRDTAWRGAAVLLSTDGLSYSAQDTVTVMSSAGTASKPEYHVRVNNTIDTDASVIVTPINGAFNSIDLTTAMANGTENYAAWGKTGRYEIVRFMTATPRPDGTVEISNIQHGVRDSGGFSTQHQRADNFVLLDQNKLAEMAIDDSHIGSVLFTKVVTLGTSEDSTSAVPLSYEARARQPFAPHSLHGVKSGANWNLSWTRQDRVQAGFLQEPGASDPNNYEVYLLTPSGAIAGTFPVSDATNYTLPGYDIGRLRWGVAQVSNSVGSGNVAAAVSGGALDDYRALAAADPDFVDFWWLTNPTFTYNMYSETGTRTMVFSGNPQFDGPPLRADDLPSIEMDTNDRATNNGVDMTPFRSFMFWIVRNNTNTHVVARNIFEHVKGSGAPVGGGLAIEMTDSGNVKVTQYKDDGTTATTLTSVGGVGASDPVLVAVNLPTTAGGAMEIFLNGELDSTVQSTVAWAWPAPDSSWYTLLGYSYLRGVSGMDMSIMGLHGFNAPRTVGNQYIYLNYMRA